MEVRPRRLGPIASPEGLALTLLLASLLLGGAAGQARAAGPEGTSYELEPMLAADGNGDGQDELYTVASGPGDFVLQFGGAAESLPSYCCGLGTVPTVSESFTDNGNGTSTVAIDVTTSAGSDLFPGGLVTVPGNVPLEDAALRIGYFTGSNPLDWSPAPVVTAASVNLFSGGSSVSGGPIPLDPAVFFGAPGAWSGHLGVVLPGFAGRETDRIELRILVRNPTGGGHCVADATHLCLNGERFRVSAAWSTDQGTSGSGQAVVLTGDTGFFWFFNAANVEMVVKVLDGCGLNQRFWVFVGGLTNVHVDLRVEDLVAGQVRTYTNLLGQPFQPIQDTGAFGGCPGSRSDAATTTAALTQAMSEVASQVSEEVAELAGAGAYGHERASATCSDSSTGLCLAGGRFRVSANWRTPDGDTGVGRAVRLTADTAYYWFFNSSNVELVVKVLDACSLNGHYWVFAAGLTNVEVEVIVEDTVGGGQRRYLNELGNPYQPLQDTAAFACQSYLPENWQHYDGELPVLWVDPAIPQGGQPATVNVRSPGASAITLNAAGDGCGGLESQTAGGAQLTQTDAVGAFGECLLTAAVTTGGTTATHRASFTVEPTSLELPPLELVGGWFQPGDPPAATAGAPVILRVDAPEEVVSGGIAEFRIEFADPAFAASVDTVYVKVPSSAGYNGYWEGPARAEGSAVLAELRLDPAFDDSRALEQFTWRRSAADDYGRLGVVQRADSSVAVAVGAGTRVTAPAAVTVSTTPVDSRLVQVSLTFQTPTDVDLHIVEPLPGVEIYYGMKRSPASGAELNVDSICKGGTENVTWPGAALSGEHIVRVEYFRACDHEGSTPYTVTTRICGVETIIRPSTPFTGEGTRGGAGSGVEVARFTARCKFRVRGKAEYEDRIPKDGGLGPKVPKAIRFAKVFVYDENNVERGQGNTKQDGSFDVQFDLPTGTMYRVEVEARSDTMVLQRVADRSGAVYKVGTDPGCCSTPAPNRTRRT